MSGTIGLITSDTSASSEPAACNSALIDAPSPEREDQRLEVAIPRQASIKTPLELRRSSLPNPNPRTLDRAYWVIDPEARTITAWDGDWDSPETVSSIGAASVSVLEGFTLEVKTLFA